MARYAGSSSSKEAKDIALELEQLGGNTYKYNLDYLRLVELLLAYRIVEQVCDYENDLPIEDKVCKVEIPLIGKLTITPRKFHDKHRLTDEPSLHFDFDFKPTSGFKADILKAYVHKENELQNVLAEIYGQRLQDLYRRMKEG